MEVILLLIGSSILSIAAYEFYKERKQKIIDTLFESKLENILSSEQEEIPIFIKIKELCRNTEGRMSYGVYTLIDLIEKKVK